MRIAHVASNVHKQSSGLSATVLRLCAELASAGHEVVLHTLAPGVERESFAVEPHHSWPIPRRLGVSPPMRKALQVRAPSYDVIHASGLWVMPSIYAASATLSCETPLLISPHGMLNASALSISRRRKRAMWLIAQRGAIERATAVHATSNSEAEAVRAAGVTAPIAVIPHGVDLPELRGLRTEKTVLYLGRLHRIKRIDRLVKAWSLLGDPGEWRLRIVGPDDDPGYVRALRRMAGGLRHVELVPPVVGVDRTTEYERAGVLVLPSEAENFGMVAAECLAAGTPVIVTQGAPWQRLAEQGCGWWVEPTVEAIACALREAMALDVTDLDTMGRLGRHWMEREFSWATIASHTAAAYEWARYGGPSPAWIRP